MRLASHFQPGIRVKDRLKQRRILFVHGLFQEL
jgi:hypothetical protein